MEFGLGVLRRSSDEFWGMTPRELDAAASARQPVRHMQTLRAGLSALMAVFPDDAITGSKE